MIIIIIHYYSTIDDNKQCFFSKARLFSASAPRASSWLTVVPTVELGVHLDPSELGVHLDPSELGVHLDPSEFFYSNLVVFRCGHLWGLPCPLCNDIALDLLGHHAATCR